MAIASFALPNLFESFQALLARAVPPRRSRARRPAAAAAVRPQPCAPLKPLRVVRVLEPSASRAVAGRMVISGRMADVCAELDRLAALEAR
jgi:hypothetical protein